MRKLQAEAWARRVIEQVKKKTKVEDDQVELKSKLIPFERAARRIAAHANKSRGEDILWLIGIDEETGLVGVPANSDFAPWWQQVKACFDEESPRLEHQLTLEVDNFAIMMLLFETDRYPFVVKNPTGKGYIDREVPWRDGTTTRSAHRSELVLLVVRPEWEPHFEVQDAGVTVMGKFEEPDTLVWAFTAEVYAKVTREAPLTFPNHDASVTIEFPNIDSKLSMNHPLLAAPRTMPPGPTRRLSLTVDSTPDELFIHGPGKFYVRASLDTDLYAVGLVGERIDFSIALQDVFHDGPYHLGGTLWSVPNDEKGPGRIRAGWAMHPKSPSWES